MASLMDRISNFFGGDASDHEGLRGLFISELRGIYYVEQQLVDALAEQADAATTNEVRNAFLQHQEETRGQVDRLERVFSSIGEDVDDMICEAADGLVADIRTMMSNTESGSLTRDAALIINGQKVEHYEIAAYGSLKTLARVLGFTEAARLLDQSLQEEKNTDKKLTQLAESFVNQRAAGEQDNSSTYHDNDEDMDRGMVNSADTGTYQSGESYSSGRSMGRNSTYGSFYDSGTNGGNYGKRGMKQSSTDMNDRDMGRTGSSTPGDRTDRDATLGGTSDV